MLPLARKVSGYRKPSKVNEVAFERAVEDVTEATRKMLAVLINKSNREMLCLVKIEIAAFNTFGE